MKNLSSKLITLFFFLLGTTTAFGQWGPGQPQIDHTSFNLQRQISLNEDSEKKEILIPISGPIVRFTINIASRISEGELTIEMYDPSGEKQGNYSVDNQISARLDKSDKNAKMTNKEIVTGKIDKSIEYPISGNWKVLIIPKNASGELLIESNQMSTKQIPDKANKR